ncbi:hypothetical protein [Wenxinia marina]|uniref:Uncharacterized protein n=1 Tax=Wenxinia marina DSM 24838 TaxID=1123501 RepID=A0A0D0Q8R2_9RHOB|nr:hypothetical protein [Wenxinia marina]KIQ70784.1 hypothetical protein Wenmar_00158 [Wenxinia marina DSM 24838]GGL57336.1 hypothetical protein GCM10011392_09740 [Wenxinia marina]
MEHRGLVLILLALTLLLSPLALRHGGAGGTGGGSDVRETVTVGAAQAACDADSVQIRNLRLGCRGGSQIPDLGRRLSSGGAVFLSARN